MPCCVTPGKDRYLQRNNNKGTILIEQTTTQNAEQ